MTKDEILEKGFFNDRRWLSNMWPCKVFFNNLLFPSVENAYQSQKNPRLEAKFVDITPIEAKRKSKTVTIVPDWEARRLRVMRTLIAIKFEDQELAQQLIDTGDEPLIEYNWWGDTFWGVCSGKGENTLGKMLMKQRDYLTLP